MSSSGEMMAQQGEGVCGGAQTQRCTCEKWRGWFASIGEDGVIAICSLQQMKPICILGGHVPPVLGLHWDPLGNYLLATCAQETAFVWELTAGTLDRHATGQFARDIIAQFLRTVASQDQRIDLPYPTDLFSRLESLALVPSSLYTQAQAQPPHSDMVPRVLRSMGGCASPITAHGLHLGSHESPVPVIAIHIKSLVDQLRRTGATPDLHNAYLPYLAFLLPWGFDAALDRQLAEQFNATPPPLGASFAVMNKGNYTVLLPTLSRGTHVFTHCAYITATYSLAAVSVFFALLSAKGTIPQDLCSSLITHFSVLIPEQTRGYCEPSLKLLTQHYQSTCSEIRHACRALFEGTTKRMRSTARTQLADVWKHRLPDVKSLRPSLSGSSSSVGEFGCALSTDQMSGLMVLATLGLQDPECLDAQTTERITHILLSLVQTADLQASVAADLLQTGYQLWRPYIRDLSSLFRHLFAIVAEADLSSVRHAPPQPAAPPPGAVFSSSLVQQQPPGPPQLTENQVKHRMLAKSAFNALVGIGRLECKAFVHVLSERMGKSGTTVDILCTITALRCLRKWLDKTSFSLHVLHILPSCVELVVHSLDASIASKRKAALPHASPVIRALVDRFPSVAFFQELQRLAVGTTEAHIAIYDLRTATKWRVLEGHTGGVTSIAFSPKGTRLASYSLYDGTLRIWQTDSGGLLGFLGFQGKCARWYRVPPVTGDVKRSAAEQIQGTRIVWTSQSTVQLRRVDDTTPLTFRA